MTVTRVVTGATGFVGGALVLELLQRTSDPIVCIVRPQSGDVADCSSIADAVLDLVPIDRVAANAVSIALSTHSLPGQIEYYRIVRRLLEHFPDARFVHIVRDGRNAALSKSRHRDFKMAFACFQLLETLGCDPFLSDDRRGRASSSSLLANQVWKLLPRVGGRGPLQTKVDDSCCGS